MSGDGGGGTVLRFLGARAARALVALELMLWRRAGQAPVFWWRDDDARAPSANLARLMDLAAEAGAPLALAVIPDGTPESLREAVARHPMVRVIQHGCDHLDRNPAGGFSAEFAPATPPAEVASRIDGAWRRLSRALPAQPVYAPPWNRLTANVAEALPLTSLRAVSTYGGDEAPVQGLARVNAHIDVMKWRPARFRGEAALWLRLWRQLRARRLGRRWPAPIGWLTHHMNLDEEGWRFMTTLLGWLGPANPRVRWASVEDLAQL